MEVLFVIRIISYINLMLNMEQVDHQLFVKILKIAFGLEPSIKGILHISYKILGQPFNSIEPCLKGFLNSFNSLHLCYIIITIYVLF